MTDSNSNSVSVVNIDGIFVEKEIANNDFFVQNVIKNRFLNPAYKTFHLFIQKVFKNQYPELHPEYNKAINILDDEDQIITNTLVNLYKDKIDLIGNSNIEPSDFNLQQLERGFEIIVEQIKEY